MAFPTGDGLKACGFQHDPSRPTPPPEAGSLCNMSTRGESISEPPSSIACVSETFAPARLVTGLGEKKKRAKAKQAEEKKKQEQVQEPELESGNKRTETEQTQPAPTKWCRIFSPKKATHRPVDVDKINEMLEKRSKSKAKKDYTVSDEITTHLIALEIVYDDDNREWHTRALLTDEQKQAKKKQAKKRVSAKQDATEEPATKKRKNNKAGKTNK